jgi:zinc transport system ATP-binding protein
MNRHVCCSGHPEQVSTDPTFIEMFGVPGAENLALYSHHHNHVHNVHGDVVQPAKADAKREESRG